MKRLFIIVLVFFIAKEGLLAQERRQIDHSDPLFSTGFFFEWNMGFYLLNEQTSGRRTILSPTGQYLGIEHGILNRPSIPCFGLTHKLGFKIYLSGNEKHRLGIQIVLLQGGFLTGGSDGSFYISFGGLGLATIHKFSKELGLEANCSVGPNFLIGDAFPFLGALIDADVKLRFNHFAVGLRLAYGFGFKEDVYGAVLIQMPELALTLGAKF